LPKDSNQVAGYRLSAEELLAGHPKDDSQVAGYSQSIFYDWIPAFAGMTV